MRCRDITRLEEKHGFDMLKLINSVHRHTDDGMDFFVYGVTSILAALKVVLSEETALFEMFRQYISKAKKRITDFKLVFTYNDLKKCFAKKDGVVLNTIHGIKGDEYSTVIGFGLLNGYLPNWAYIIQPDLKPYRNCETKRLLYVLCSRAKINLFLFSETGHKTQSHADYRPTDELFANEGKQST